jgi:starch synthase
VVIAAECEPWAKTGGLGDVVDALARSIGALPGELDGQAEVFLPRYRGVPVPPGAAATRRLRVPDPYGGGADGTTEVGLIELDADGYRLRLVDHPAAFDRDGFYGDAAGDFPDNAWRFGLLCRAALEALRADGRPVDLISLHDWQAGPAVAYRDLRYADDPIVGRAAIATTVHNLAYHGWTPAESVGQLGLTRDEGLLVWDGAGIDLLGIALERAEVANTVSPTFAEEALTPEYGKGLDAILRRKEDRFVGILNGLDTELWDPAADPVLAAPYAAASIAGKAACRADLLQRTGLDPADDGPVFGMIGRLDPQKGFDLAAAIAEPLVAAGGRLVVQGSGDPAIAALLRAAAAAHPGRVALVERFDREMARRIYAGADLFVMPSRFEPCGQGQMIALRYGTPPIVRRTGGLADTVVDATERPRSGTGVVFDPATPEALLAACLRAAELRAAGGRRWAGIVARGMALDFDWRRSAAPRYLALFRRAVRLRAAARRG